MKRGLTAHERGATMRACSALLLIVALLTGCAPGAYEHRSQVTCERPGVNCRDTSYVVFTPEPSPGPVPEWPFRGRDVRGGGSNVSVTIGNPGGFTSPGVRPTGGEDVYNHQTGKWTIRK